MDCAPMSGWPQSSRKGTRRESRPGVRRATQQIGMPRKSRFPSRICAGRQSGNLESALDHPFYRAQLHLRHKVTERAEMALHYI